MDSVQPNLQEDFKKGKALLISLFFTMGFLVIVGVLSQLGISVPFSSIFAGIMAFIYDKHQKIKSEKGVTWGPLGHFIFIALLSVLGALVFFYDVQKAVAKRKGLNVDSKQDVLFIVLLVGLMVLLLGVSVLSGLEGYNQATTTIQNNS